MLSKCVNWRKKSNRKDKLRRGCCACTQLHAYTISYFILMHISEVHIARFCRHIHMHTIITFRVRFESLIYVCLCCKDILHNLISQKSNDIWKNKYRKQVERMVIKDASRQTKMRKVLPHFVSGTIIQFASFRDVNHQNSIWRSHAATGWFYITLFIQRSTLQYFLCISCIYIIVLYGSKTNS